MVKIKYKNMFKLCMIFLVLTVACLISVSDINAYSTDRTDYYYDGTYYLTDNLEVADIALNGTAPSNTTKPTSYGWTAGDGYSDNSIYTTAVSTLGSLSIKTSASYIEYNMPDNDTFTGLIGFKMRIDASPWLATFNVITADGQASVYTYDTITSNHWWYYDGDAHTCDESTSEDIITGEWMDVLWNFTADNNLHLYYNNVLCHTFAFNGLRSIKFGDHQPGSTYLDEFWISNGERPGGSPTPSTTSITTTLISPSNNTNSNLLNQSFTFNVTTNTNISTVDNCTLYLNDTGIWVGNGTLTNVAINTTQTINHNFSNFSTYLWNVLCINGTNTSDFGNTNFTLTIDVTYPNITINPSNGFKEDNSTIISSYLHNLTLNLSFFDDNLLFTLINITNSSGVSIYQELKNSTGNTTYNFSKDISLTGLSLGNYTIKLLASDSHTKNKIKDYKINRLINKITFQTEEKNTISISSFGSYNTKYNKKIDKYEFGFDYVLKDKKRTYIVESDNPIIHIPKSPYIGHLVVWNRETNNGNWIDFQNLQDNDAIVTKINDYKYQIEFKNLNEENEVWFNSIGGLNIIENHYKFGIGAVLNFTAINPLSGVPLNFTSNIDGITKHSSVGSSNSVQYENITAGVYTLNINVSGFDLYSVSYNVTSVNQSLQAQMFNTNVIDTCANYTNTLLTFFGKNEEINNTNIVMDLDLTVFHTALNNLSLNYNTSFIFSGQTNYSICTNYNQTFLLDAIMEYGGGIYSERKYYLNNYTANSSVSNTINLYHLNTSKSSEITFTVYDAITGSFVPEVFIKILRYYPGENVYKTVEIVKTDEQGKSLGKMVLADVFYKFILEYPAGTIKLETDVLRALSLTRTFAISLTSNVLDTWEKIHGVSKSVTCTLSTKTCRVTWSDTSNIVQDVTLEVWKINGLNNELLYTQTTSASAGTISYTVVESTLGNKYEARAFAESNTGTSYYGWGYDGFEFYDNPFFNDPASRFASLFPLFLLALVIIFALVDFGAVGVTIGALLSLIVGSVFGIFPMSIYYLVSFILMGVILIYKVNR